MQKFNANTGLLAGRRSLLFTEAALAASGRHERAAKTLGQHLGRWSGVWEARRDAEDAITRGNARVAWCDFTLDRAVTSFANELLRDAGGKSSHKDFQAFFPEPPSEVIRLGLQAQIARCESLFVVASKRKLSARAAAALKSVRDAMTHGEQALATRREAYVRQAEAALDAQSWREGAEAARQGLYVQLQAWALENGENRSYADRFFPDGKARRASAAKAAPNRSAEGEEDLGEKAGENR